MILPFAVCSVSHVLVCERMFLTVGDLYFKMVARRFVNFLLMLPLLLFLLLRLHWDFNFSAVFEI